MDALLKEQAKKREADEALLEGVEKALDEAPEKKVSPWRRAMPLSIAALLALTIAGVMMRKQDFAPQLAVNDEAPANEVGERISRIPATPKPDLEKAMKPADPAPLIGAEVQAPAASPPAAEASREQAAIEARLTGMSADGLAAKGEVQPAPTEVPLAKQPAPAREMTLTRQKKVAGNQPTEADASLMEGARRGIDPRGLSLPVPRPPRPDEASDDLFGGGFVFGDESDYAPLVDQPWKSPWQDALSTFSIDVDTASYSNLRRMIREGRNIQPDAVRIEELVNYFDFQYPAPEGDNPFRVQSVLASCPWQEDHLLARVAIKGREIEKNARPASNLVFLIDVSGSMQSPDKLPMLKRAMQVLIEELDERDRVGMVVYAGTEGVVLPPTRLDQEGKSKAIAALAKLEAGGSTNGGAGLTRAYEMALENLQEEGVNRVILASDGDFNVGTTGQGELVRLVKERAAKGVSLSVLGFGTGNLNDAMMEAITNDGNGNYFYVDSDREAKRVFLDKLSGTLVTIAKDVKIQVEFNPGKVKAYRLIGYANRVLRDQDFNNDKVDAGDIGAGHTVTAFYEIVPVGVNSPTVGEVDGLRYQRPEGRKELVESDDWFTLKLRYKHPKGDKSRLIETPVKGGAQAWEEAGNDFRLASAVALFGMKLRHMEDVAAVSWDRVVEIAQPTLAEDPKEQRAEFLELVKSLK
ncbi:MAG: von Willebrand factor type A domain-containing protein [Verrucomicrobiota bacterium]